MSMMRISCGINWVFFEPQKGASRLLTEGVLETLLSYIVTPGLWKEMEGFKSPEHFFKQPLCCAVKMHSVKKSMTVLMHP